MAVEAFLKLGDLKGESQVKGFENQIEVLAWSWGMSQTGTMHRGTGGGAGKVNVQDLSFTHHLDAASPALIQSCCTGRHFPEATLVVRKAGGKEPLPYLTIKLTNIIVTSVSDGGSSGQDTQTQNVTLNFAAFDFKYQQQNDKGAKSASPSVTFDIAKNAET